MIDHDKVKSVMGEQAFAGQGDSIDSRIEENIQKRELIKLRSAFHDNLKQHYRQRKYKE